MARGTVVAGFAVLFLGVMVAEYLAFARGLAALRGLGLAGAALTLYFVESVLVLVLLVSLLSFVASGLYVCYRAPDLRFLRASPLSTSALYALRVVQTFALTSWALAIVGLPAVLALGIAYGAPPAFYAVAAGVLGLYAAFGGGVAALLTTLAAAAVARVPTRLAVGSAIAVLLLGFVLVVGRHVVPSAADFQTIFEPEMLNGKPASIKFIERKFVLWPSHPFATTLYRAATGRAAGSPATRVAVWLLPALAVALAATAGRRLYARTLPGAMERFALAGGGARSAARSRAFPRRLRGPIGALVERDLVTLARDPHELARLGFIAFLLALYTSFLFVAPVREAGDRPWVLARLTMFNVLAAGYFLTAFGLRFVFPSVSLEGRAAWLFFSAPIRVRRLVLAKLGVAVVVPALAVVPIALAGTLRLVRDPGLALVIGAMLLLLVATTATLLLGFGSAWPDFRQRDPEVLSTSGSGLLATVASLGYVALMGWLARGAVLATSRGDGGLGWLGGATLVSGALVGAGLVLIDRGTRTLEAR